MTSPRCINIPLSKNSKKRIARIQNINHILHTQALTHLATKKYQKCLRRLQKQLSLYRDNMMIEVVNQMTKSLTKINLN